MTSFEIMPKPFDWIPIPAGQLTLGKGWNDKAHGVGQTFKVDSCHMAKYPVTNAQFAKFIEAGGYENKAWWTETGWKQRKQKRWSEPRYWSGSKWNNENQPVVGITWYEAVAFCLWLSDTTGEEISLPTEQQWQYAAQGDDGRVYPWGNEWDSSKCQNSVDSKAGKTSDVKQYEGKGDSPFGVVDMTGNIQEFCLTAYGTDLKVVQGINSRVLRGGFWVNDTPHGFRCDINYYSIPHDWTNFSGFRIVRNK